MFFKFSKVIFFVSFFSFTALGSLKPEPSFYKKTIDNSKIIATYLEQNENVLNTEETMRLIMTQVLSSITYGVLNLVNNEYPEALKNPDILQEIEEGVMKGLDTYIKDELVNHFSSNPNFQKELSVEIAQFFPSLCIELSQWGVDGFLLNSIGVFNTALAKADAFQITIAEDGSVGISF